MRESGLADAEVRVSRGEAAAPARGLPRGLEGQAVTPRAVPASSQSRGHARLPRHHRRLRRPVRGAPARGARRRGLRGRRLRVERRDRGARDRAVRRRRRSRGRRRSRRLLDGVGGAARVYEPDDWKAPYASGSAKVDAYVLCPCSMGTLGTLASGSMQNLIHRAASVALKEERRLVLMPRETPLSAIHLRNMLTLREAGATILFLAPGFYHGAETVGRPRRLRRRHGARPARSVTRARATPCHCRPVGRHDLTGRSDVTVETGRLPADGVRRMFDRIAPVYDLMNRVMTAGLDRRWRALDGRPQVVRPGDRVLDACCGTGDLAVAARARRRGRGGGARLLRGDARAGAREGARDRVGAGRRARAAVPGRVLRRRDRRLRHPQRRGPRGGPARAPPRASHRAAGSASSRSRRRAASSRRSTGSGSTA